MTILRAIKILFLIFSISCIGSCNLINPEEQAPVYVRIDKFTVSSDYLTQGTNSDGVESVWVYADGIYIGTYQLPTTFPLLLSGVHKLQLGAGILENGVDATREAYPLYKFYEADLDFTPGDTLRLDTLNVAYFPVLKYTWYEDMEGSGVSIDTLTTGKIAYQVDSTQAFEGNKCLKLYVHDSLNVLECASNDSYTLPLSADCYLELNYKCNKYFYVGLIANYPTYSITNPVIKINPSENWNKIYIRLNPTLSANGTATDFRVWFRIDLNPTEISGTALIDNIKLIHR